ncbi:MAG TPA: glycosyltransferase family 2 protein [Acidimicrobiia bacterium]|nr:glycosyltransferase family 2 protein [Acidimicrobiia bacterium]
MTNVSVVVPVYSGEDYLQELTARLGAVRESWIARYEAVRLLEVIFVDDGSVDGSSEMLTVLAARHDWVQVVTLSKNFGQHPATSAGILHSSGDWVATIDEDLQHGPEDIETMLLAAATTNADVVYGESIGPIHGSWRDSMSRFYKRLLATVTGNPVIMQFSSFRVCRGPVARAAASVSGHETYLDVALTWFTDRFVSQRLEMVDGRYRAAGRSGYSFFKLLGHARRLLISSHTRIGRLGVAIGVAAVMFALIMTTRVMVGRLRGLEELYVPGYASLMVAILVFGGILALLLIGVTEYLLNIALHTQGKPTYFAVDRSADERLAKDLQAGVRLN